MGTPPRHIPWSSITYRAVQFRPATSGFELGDCGCYYPTEEDKRIGAASYAFTVEAVTDDRKAWLRSLPRELRIEVERYRLHLVHGSPRRINEYLLPDRDERTFHRLAAAEAADILVFGHTHSPWHRTYGRVLFVNVGSVGRARDGDPRAAYTRLTMTGGDTVVQDVRVPYDVAATVRAVVDVGLPMELAERMERGV